MRELLFISGSRADYNKVSKIIKFLAKSNHVTVLLVDMHSDEEFGYTGRFVVDDLKDFKNVTVSNIGDCKTKRTLFYFGWLVEAIFEFVKNNNLKMTFVHGDRLSALAGAIASSYNNVPVCQIEAGDVSGNIDESIRHAITKFSHRFLVTDDICKKRVMQLGEDESSIYNIGMTSIFADGINNINTNLTKELGQGYCVCIYHPLCFKTAQENLINFQFVIQALKKFSGKVLLIHCNNDPNGDLIIKEYERLEKDEQIVFRKNVPPEKFYYILKNASFIIGNSSCGICEAPYLGVPTIDIGSRQQGRSENKKINSIFHIEDCSCDLESLIEYVINHKIAKKKTSSLSQFEKILAKTFDEKFFKVDMNKKFILRL